MDLFALQEKYKSVPNELKTLKRWICFKVEGREDGKTTKRPYNALNGKFARVNDDLTWSNFNIALNGCIKYHCDGLGFVLGNGIFGIKLKIRGRKALKPSQKRLRDGFPGLIQKRLHLIF